MSTAFYATKRAAMHTLQAWGAANIVVGAALVGSRHAVLRQIGIQAIAWGAIDGALGLNGARGADQEERDGRPAHEIARRDCVILAINTLLDVGYIAGGAWALRSAKGRADRAGIGIGIIIQGLFLLKLDTVLTVVFGRFSQPRGIENGELKSEHGAVQ